MKTPARAQLWLQHILTTKNSCNKPDLNPIIHAEKYSLFRQSNKKLKYCKNQFLVAPYRWHIKEALELQESGIVRLTGDASAVEADLDMLRRVEEGDTPSDLATRTHTGTPTYFIPIVDVAHMRVILSWRRIKPLIT